MYTGLLVKCPYDVEDNNCPFKVLRQKGLYGAYKIWNRLSEEEQSVLINQHLQCTNNFYCDCNSVEDSLFN